MEQDEDRHLTPVPSNYAAALIASAIAALERADLTEALDLVKCKLLSRPLCEEDGTLIPMVELVLYEVRDISRRPHLTTPVRAQLITNTLTLAGYF